MENSTINQKCENLVKQWLHIAKIKFLHSEDEKEKIHQKFIQHGAICYFNCARQLQGLIKSGDMPLDFNLEVLKQNPE